MNFFLLWFKVIKELKERVAHLKENERWVALLHDEMTIKADLVRIVYYLKNQ